MENKIIIDLNRLLISHEWLCQFQDKKVKSHQQIFGDELYKLLQTQSSFQNNQKESECKCVVHRFSLAVKLSLKKVVQLICPCQKRRS